MTVVHLPSPLFAHTGGASRLEVPAATIAEALAALDARFPGIRHRVVDEQDRIRPHILFAVNDRFVRDIAHPLGPGDELRIIAALSGG